MVCWFTGCGGVGCPVPEVAAGYADGGVELAMVLLMPLAWVLWVSYLVLVCIGVVRVGEDGGAAGDGEGVVLA